MRNNWLSPVKDALVIFLALVLLTSFSTMGGVSAQSSESGTLTVLSALCPASYVGNASADECDDNPVANMPFRIGIPNTEAFTNYTSTSGDGIVNFEMFPSDTVRIIAELPQGITRYVVYCVDGFSNELDITYPDDAGGNQALGLVDVSAHSANDVLCDWYNVPFLPVVKVTEAPDQARNCATADVSGDVSTQFAMDGGDPARTGEQPGPGPKGIPLLDEAFLQGLRAPVGETPICGIRTKEGTPILATDGVAYVGGTFNAPGSDSIAPERTTWGLLAINTDGSGVRWFAPLLIGANARGYFGTPTISNGSVYVSTPTEFIRLDAATGAEQWKITIESGGVSSPVIIGDVIYTTSGTGVVYSFDARTGQELWHLWLGDWGLTEPAVVGGVVYVGGSDGSLYAISGKSGKPMWRHETEGHVYVGPAIVNGLAYITTDKGILSAIDTKDGTQRWQMMLASPNSSAATYIVPPVAVVDGSVYVGGKDSLRSFDAMDGHELWKLETDGSSLSSSTVAVGIVYTLSLDGTLYAVAGKTGMQLWSYDTPADGPFGEDGRPIWLPAPAVSGGVVYFTNVHGWIYAVAGS